MFKKFTVDENVSSTSQVKNSVVRGITAQLIEQYPHLETIMDDLIPKKSMTIAKCTDKVQIILSDNIPIFFNERDGPYLPTLKLLHKYPQFMKRMQADKGAIPFILGGANIMAPGFTSPGGDIPFDLEEGDAVAIYVEGKEHAVAVGIMKMSTSDVKSINKGVCVENCHSLLDGLWMTKDIS